MKFITNLLGQTITYAVIGAGCVIGYMAGSEIYCEKIGPKLKEKLRK